MRYGNENGSYSIVELPGCAQIAVSVHSFVYPQRRGKGNGKLEHARRLKVIKRLGYDVVLCTVNLGNSREVKILNGAGWTMLTSFKSSSSQNEVGIFSKHIKRSVSV